jgi:aspartate-semialdehyde dehydrogenase
MVVVLAPIHKTFKIKRIVVCSYQAASGAGRSAVQQLFNETKEVVGREQDFLQSAISNLQSEKVMPQQVAFNIFPHIGGFAEADYTSEEWKMVKETHKIMHAEKIKISATCVRVPVRTGHSEAVYIETKKDISVDAVRGILKNAPGVELVDDVRNNIYPLPINAEGKDAVYVGRLRKDPFVKNGFWLWVVSDNLRKGAALNAVQIAELLIKK